MTYADYVGRLLAEDLELPVKVTLGLEPGTAVVILTEEGAVRRGRRRWHAGSSIGFVQKRHVMHTRGWHVVVNGHEVLLFEDELALVHPDPEENAA